MRQLLCPRLIGRDEELASISAALDAAQDGRGSAQFVLGEAGVGKSRLSLETERLAAARGFRTLRGHCVEAGQTGSSMSAGAFRPIAEALLSALRRDVASCSRGAWDQPELRPFKHILSRLIPDWRDANQPPADESLVLLAEAVLRVLRALGSSPSYRGCLLVLEDVHWADAETLSVLEYLAVNAAEEPIVILVTSRPSPHSPSKALLWSLAARRVGEIIELQRLGPTAVREMASACLDDARLPEAIEPLLEASAEGLPLLVEDLLAEWANAGALLNSDGTWHLRQLPGPLVPTSFSETVRRRLHQLGDDATRLLRLAALLGRRFDWKLLMAADLNEERVLELLQAAVDAQLVVAEPSAFVFRHALTRDAVLAELLPAERARQAARLLELVEASKATGDGDWRDVAADLATIAGDRTRAATLLLESGRALLAAGALASAEATLERARSLVPLQAQGELQAQVDYALLRVLVDAGNYERVIEVGGALLTALARGAARSIPPAQVHLVLASAAAAASDYPEAVRQLDLARTLDCERAFEARLDALAARVAIDQHRTADADRLAHAALAAAQSHDEIEVACDALIVIGRLARQTDLDAAEVAFERVRELAQEHRLVVWECRARHELGTIDMFRNAAPERLLEARAMAADSGALETVAWVEGELAALFNTRFEMERSFQHARAALEAGRRFRLRGVEAMALVFEAEVYAYRLDRAAMEHTLDALARVSDDAFFQIVAWECRGIVSLLEEDRQRAVRELENAAQVEATLHGVAPSPTLALWALNRTLDDPENPEARELLRASYSIVNFCNAGFSAYADAIALGRQGQCDAAVAAARAADELLRPAAWFHHYAQRLVGEAAVRDGWGEPTVWLAEAQAFFERNGYQAVSSACRSLLRRSGATIPRAAAHRRVPEPFRSRGVTERELEVLTKLADGMSNKEIGSRLYLSPKTVEKHVASLMDKLDVRTRAGLASIASANLGDATSRSWGKPSM